MTPPDNHMQKEFWPKTRRIGIVCDPPGWFQPFAESLAEKLTVAGHPAQLLSRQGDVAEGDIAFYLSCTGITPPELLLRNCWNLVVHASALPEGRGFSPLVWQTLEGKTTIPLTMISMAEDVDTGDILMRRDLELGGHELNDEMRDAMGRAIVQMCFDFATAPSPPEPQAQKGAGSWYPRRGPADSVLDPEKTISEQFDLLRVVDNENYPAFFNLRGHRYTLYIHRETPEDKNS